MGCDPVVYCRACNEPLDVFMPFDERFCCKECENEELGDPRTPEYGVGGL